MLRLIKQWISDNLGFSQGESNATLILIIIILIVAIVPRLMVNNQGTDISFDQIDLNKDNWNFQSSEMPQVQQTPTKPETIGTVFSFDPNKISYDSLLLLGLPPKVSSRVINYREKGGQFKKTEDLKKIYGLSDEHFSRLSEYVEIRKSNDIKALFPNEDVRKAELDLPKFEINSATEEQFKSISGIGDKLAARIVKYRNQLGGFHHTRQLSEVYGLNQDVITRLLDNSYLVPNLKQINLNTDSLQHLERHPYIDNYTAKVIFNYRKQRGRIDSVSQLKQIKIISDSLYQKIYPYLSIQP